MTLPDPPDDTPDGVSKGDFEMWSKKNGALSARKKGGHGGGRSKDDGRPAQEGQIGTVESFSGKVCVV